MVILFPEREERGNLVQSFFPEKREEVTWFNLSFLRREKR